MRPDASAFPVLIAAARRAALALLVLALAGGPALADEKEVIKRVRERFPQSLVENVFATPYPGLYEVLMDNKLFYTDEQVSYILVGNLIDVKTSLNLTQQRLRKLTAIDWKALPLELAIKKVKGDGSRRLAVFSDPMCPHCITQEKELAKVTNVTIYTFMYPIERLHKGATERSRGVWCSPDRAKAWDALLLDRSDPKSKPCADPLKKIEALGAQLKIDVTPTLIFGDGTVVSGGLLAQQVEKHLAEVGKR
ncbi:MAG: DsbC family protein [Burkholderiales bacterium]|nr:DsbC family protein [Burkholderiales bacterium]